MQKIRLALALAASFTSVASLALASPAASGVPDRLPARCSLDRATGTTIDAAPVIPVGYGANWSAAKDRIAFTKPDIGGFYRVFTVRPGGAGMRPIDAAQPQIPRKHQGTPMSHPSGRWIMFTAEKAKWTGRKLSAFPTNEALPGYGMGDACRRERDQASDEHER